MGGGVRGWVGGGCGEQDKLTTTVNRRVSRNLSFMECHDGLALRQARAGENVL